MGGIANAITPFTGTGSSQNGSSSGSSYTNFQAPDQAAIRGAQEQLSPLVQNLIGMANRSASSAQGNANNINTGFSPFNVQLQQPNFNQGLDSTAKNLMSVEQANNAARTGAQTRQIASQFSGSNPGLSQILQQQTRNASNLQNNPLAFQASQEQTSRLGNQAQINNQAALQQSQNNAGLQAQGNAANLQQQQATGNALNFQNAGVGAAQNQLATLLGLGQAMGQQVQGGTQQAKGKSGGLFS